MVSWRIAVTLFLLFWAVISCWTIDVSVGTMTVPNGFMTNGFFNVEPVRMYHVGLYSLLNCVFWLSLIAVNLWLTRDEFIKLADEFKEHLEGEKVKR
jgi:uncharacterized membrane-anchored protein YitT (DUF2179 family)